MRLFVVLAAFSVALTSTPVASESLNANLGVRAVVVAVCEAGNGAAGNVSFGTLDFSTHYFLNSPIEVTGLAHSGGLRVKCMNGVPFKVLLGPGKFAVGSTRRMARADAAPYVTYNLYSDAGHSQVWDDVQGVSRVGTGGEQWLPVYARVPAQATPEAGNYADVVQVTVQW